MIIGKDVPLIADEKTRTVTMFYLRCGATALDLRGSSANAQTADPNH
jgi:hypothetical protein